MSFHTVDHNAAQLFDICEFVLSMLNEFCRYSELVLIDLNNLIGEQSVGYEKVIIGVCRKLKVYDLIKVEFLIFW